MLTKFLTSSASVLMTLFSAPHRLWNRQHSSKARTNELNPVEVQSLKMHIFHYKMKLWNWLGFALYCHSFTVMLGFSSRDLEYNEFIYGFESEACKICSNHNSNQSGLLHFSFSNAKSFFCSPQLSQYSRAAKVPMIHLPRADTILPQRWVLPSPCAPPCAEFAPSLGSILVWIKTQCSQVLKEARPAAHCASCI